MPDERLFDYDPTTGVRTYFSSSDDDGGSWHFRREQDVAPILDANRAGQNEAFDRRSDMWKVASIPTTILYEWWHKHGVKAWDKNHADGVKRLLNDPDYRWLKCKEVYI